MAEPQAAVSPPPGNGAAAATSRAALEELVSGLGIADDDTPSAPAAASQAAKPAAAKAEAEDDLADLDDASKPWTPARAQEVRTRLETARAKAREETRKANAASARARAQEERFQNTKSKVLDQKMSIDAREKMIGAIEQALFSGNKETVLQAIGHITRKDPLEAWTEISQAVAGGKIKKAEVPPELLNELRAMREELQQLKAAGPARDDQQMIARLRDELVSDAAKSDAFPLVSRFAKLDSTREEIRDQLASIKESEYSRQKIAIDNTTAFRILELRLQAQSELFQQVHAPNGQATDERGTTGPEPGDSAGSRQEPAKQAPSPPPRTIPAELSGRSGGTRRPASEAERIAEIARQTPASFFRDIGLGSLLEDGEE